MKGFFSLITGLAMAATLGSAQAATVNSGNPVDFVFDVAGLTPFFANNFAYACDASCADGQVFAPDLYLDADSSFGLMFGSTQGGGEFGTAYVSNPFGFPVYNEQGPFFTEPSPPGTFNPAEILISGGTSLFVRVFFVNDVFNIGFLQVGNLTGSCIGSGCDVPAPVPLPAALPLFATALGGAGILSWRRRRGTAKEL